MSEKHNPSKSSRDLIPSHRGHLPAAPLRNGQPKDDKSAHGITPQFVINAIRQWWKVAAPIGLLVAGIAGGLVLWLFEQQFEASAWIQIESKTPYVAFPNRDDSRRFVATQTALITSPLVLGPVLSTSQKAWVPDEETGQQGWKEIKGESIGGLPELQKRPDPFRWLGERIRVAQIGESELFKISYTSRDNVNAAQIVNAVADAYFQLRKDDEEVRANTVIKLLDEEKERREGEVKLRRGEVRTKAKEAKMQDPFAVEPEPTSAVLLNPLGGLQGNLTTAEVNREILKAQIRAFAGIDSAEKWDQLVGAGGDGSADVEIGEFTEEQKQQLFDSLAAQPVEIPEGMMERAVEGHPEVQARKADISLKYAKLHEIEERSAVGAKDLSYVELQKRILQDENSLRAFIDGSADGDAKDSDPQPAKGLRERIKAELEAGLLSNRKDQLAAMLSEFKGLSTTVNMLEQKFEEWKSERLKDVEQYTGDTVEFQFAQAELNRAQEVLDKITARVVALRTEKRAPERVTLRQKATPPKIAVELWPFKKMLLACLAGFLLPFGLAVFWERIVRRVGDSDQFEQQSHLAVVGEIARLPAKKVRSHGAVSRSVRLDMRLFEESIDSLRTNLTLAEGLKDMRILTVTSAANHEGKTSVASQLAVSIARACGQPTLLIDGDMRSPDVHNVFDIPLEPGFAEVLSNECDLEDAIVTSWSTHVHIVPAGRLKANPHKLLGNGSLNALLEKVPGMYRYIIIDSPPVLAASEALVLAKAADASLICAMRDVSRVDQVKKAYDRLVAAGSRPAGTVLNGVPTRRYAYRYGHYAYAYPRD